MGDLYGRLKSVKEGKKRSLRRPRSPGPLAAPPGFEIVEGVYRRRELLSYRELPRVGRFLTPGSTVSTPRRLAPPTATALSRLATASDLDGGRPEAGRPAEGRPAEGRPAEGRPAEGHLFFDLEATGLSTGAGSVAFLLGLARLLPEGVELTQWLLPDYPYEPELLLSFAHALEPRGIAPQELTLVSYNGRAFDTPLLRSRMLINAIPFEPPPQLDLLPFARRLWRRFLDDCSLSTVEASILGVSREEDVPGALVPQRYFDYLATGESEPLREVVAHHRQDILTLVDLLARVEALLRGEEESGRVDRFELGRLLLENPGVPEGPRRGEAILAELTADESGEREAIYYGWLLRRQGRLREAVAVWRSAFERHGTLAPGILLAKALEHDLSRFDEALEVVEAMLAGEESRGASQGILDALGHRQARLRRRIASS